jgi:hypothetical protein
LRRRSRKHGGGWSHSLYNYILYNDFEKETPMARARKKTVRKRILWTSADVKFLRKAAGRQPVSQISRQLKRSEAAVRYKATMLKVSLAMKKRR